MGHQRREMALARRLTDGGPDQPPTLGALVPSNSPLMAHRTSVRRNLRCVWAPRPVCAVAKDPPIGKRRWIHVRQVQLQSRVLSVQMSAGSAKRCHLTASSLIESLQGPVDGFESMHATAKRRSSNRRKCHHRIGLPAR